MDCDKYKYNLHSFADGSLNDIENKAIIKHIKVCERCKKEVGEIREIRRLLKCCSESVVFPPIDLKSSIMSSINLRKYKKVCMVTLGELKNWGMSFVAAGLILLLLNLTPTDNSTRMQIETNVRRINITENMTRPLSFINQSADSVAERILELDGISAKIERQIKEERRNEM